MASILLTLLGYVAVILVVAIVAVFVIFTLYIYHVHTKYAHLPQVPRPSFLWGHRKYFDEAIRGITDSVDEVMSDMHKELGYPPAFVVFVLHISMVFILDPKAVKEVVFEKRHGKPKELYKPFISLFGQRFIERGLLTEFDYEQWHKRRMILNTAFNRKTLKEFMEPFNKSTSSFIKTLKQKADGKTEIRMSEHFNRCALDVIAKVALGMDVDIIENEDSSFNEAVLTCFHGMVLTQDFMFHLKRFVFSEARKETKEVVKAARKIREIGRECIEKRIDAMNQGLEVLEDVLTYIIKSGQEVSGDDKEKMNVMVDEFALFFVAGMETTANLLSFAVIALGRHPEVMHRLMIEIEAVIGEKTYVTYEDLNKLDYTTQVLKETLRLWPPVSGMTRQLAFDIDVEGYNIPAGSNISFHSFLMARMEKFHDNAHDFDPDRFKTDQDKMQYTYFPFALGPKSCIGQHFALIEARVILVRFLSTFNFELVPGQKFSLLNEITTKPKEGCKVFITPK